jgi:hypothetical protein
MEPILSFFLPVFIVTFLLSFFPFKKFVFKSKTKTLRQLILKILIILLIEFLIFVLGMVGVTLLVIVLGLGGGLLSALIVPNLFVSNILISFGAVVMLYSAREQKKNTKYNKKQILINAVVAFTILIFVSTGALFLHSKIEQSRYESRVEQVDGKLYPQTEPLGLVQKIVNTPTRESGNIVINLTQYFYRSYMVFMPWNDMSQMYCCELLDRSKTPPYFVWPDNKESHHSYEVIEQNSDRQIIAVKSSFPNTNIELETYFTVVNTDKGWRVDKYRNMGSISSLYLYADKQTDKQPVFIDENTQSKYEVSIGSAELALKTDNQLIEYFNQNREKFYELNTLIQNKSLAENDTSELNISAVIQNYNNNCLTCTFFIIAGEEDDTVGYFYIEDISQLPKIDGGSLIIIRKIGDGWYFYKST